MIARDRGFELTEERVFRMKMSRLDVGGVIFLDLDGQRVTVNQIPGIAAKFAMDILNEAWWTMQPKVFSATQGHTNKPIKPNKVIHVRVRNENILGWKTGRLVFKDTPLRDVAADLSHYSGKTILIIGHELDGTILTSSYVGEDLGDILEEIRLVLNIDYTILNDTIIFHPTGE